LQLLIFRQDAPLISRQPALSAAEPYRASGLAQGINGLVKLFREMSETKRYCTKGDNTPGMQMLDMVDVDQISATIARYRVATSKVAPC
jgi:hypothetical protein